MVNLTSLKVTRPPHLTDKVVIVDGFPGCGKTMMAPIVSGLARVELIQYSYHVEYICALSFLGKIDADAATAMIRLFTDLQLYNVVISRDTNFRWTDLSGVRMSSNPWRYVRRLFQVGDEAALERIRRERPILHLTTHMLFGHLHCLFSAIEDRLRFIEIVRHPLYMLKQQFKYMPRWGTDVRDFTVWFEYEGHALPWFAKGWEKKYVSSAPMDQAIFMQEEMRNLRSTVIEGLPDARRAQIMTVPFERFVIDPWPFMKRLESFLETEVTSTTRRCMKKQNVPRKMWAEGIGLQVYKDYGWEPPRPGSDEAQELDRRRQFAAKHASPGAMEVLDRLCAEYEREYFKQASP